MSDIVDDAQAIEEMERQEAIRRLTTPTPAARSAPIGVCTGCGDEIEEERRAALPGACRCLQCQESVERSLRLFRKG
jgi:phage/conjugal plasmid C-4 type zinc finger TraR family protein